MKPVVDRLEQQYAGSIDFTVYESASATPEIKSFTRLHGVEYVPTMMIVDADGVELDRFGSVTEAELKRRLDAVR